MEKNENKNWLDDYLDTNKDNVSIKIEEPPINNILPGVKNNTLENGPAITPKERKKIDDNVKRREELKAKRAEEAAKPKEPQRQPWDKKTRKKLTNSKYLQEISQSEGIDWTDWDPRAFNIGKDSVKFDSKYLTQDQKQYLINNGYVLNKKDEYVLPKSSSPQYEPTTVPPAETTTVKPGEGVETKDLDYKTRDYTTGIDFEKATNDADEWVKNFRKKTNYNYRNDELRDTAQNISDYVNEEGISSEERKRRIKESNYYIWDALARWSQSREDFWARRPDSSTSEWEERQKDIMSKQREIDKENKSKIETELYDKFLSIGTMKPEEIRKGFENNSDLIKRLRETQFSKDDQEQIIYNNIALGGIFPTMSQNQREAMGYYLSMVQGKDISEVASQQYLLNNGFDKVILDKIKTYDANISANSLAEIRNLSMQKRIDYILQLQQELLQKQVDNYTTQMILSSICTGLGVSMNALGTFRTLRGKL